MGLSFPRPLSWVEGTRCSLYTETRGMAHYVSERICFNYSCMLIDLVYGKTRQSHRHHDLASVSSSATVPSYSKRDTRCTTDLVCEMAFLCIGGGSCFKVGGEIWSQSIKHVSDGTGMSRVRGGGRTSPLSREGGSPPCSPRLLGRHNIVCNGLFNRCFAPQHISLLALHKLFCIARSRYKLAR